MQNKFRAGVALLAAALSLPLIAACSSGTAKPAPTVTVTATKTVPAPSPSTSHATATVLDPNSPLSKSETNFQKVAIATALNVAEDAQNPESVSEAYNGTAVGNKHLELAQGLDKKGGFPEIFMNYDAKSRQVSVWSVTITNPTASSASQVFNGITMTFQSIDPALNNLERKIAVNKQLTAADFMAFFQASNISARSVMTTHGHAVEATIALAGSVYQYTTSSSSVITPITASNYSLMDTMGRDVESTELGLRSGL